MSNKETIEKALKELGYCLGSWSKKMEDLPNKELEKVLAEMEFQNDTDVVIGGKEYVVEIDEVDNEIDFSVLTKEEYIGRYGGERYS